VLDDAADDFNGFLLPAPHVPQLFAEVEVEAGDRAGLVSGIMPSMISSPVPSDNAAKMPPLWNQRTPPPKMAFQSTSPGFISEAASWARL